MRKGSEGREAEKYVVMTRSKECVRGLFPSEVYANKELSEKWSFL